VHIVHAPPVPPCCESIFNAVHVQRAVAGHAARDLHVMSQVVLQSSGIIDGNNLLVLSLTNTGFSPAATHFLAHASWAHCAFAPHLESLTHPSSSGL